MNQETTQLSLLPDSIPAVDPVAPPETLLKDLFQGLIATTVLAVVLVAGVTACENAQKVKLNPPQQPVFQAALAPVKVPDEAPVAAPVEAPAPVEHTYSYDEAMTEVCEAGRQYRNDVNEGYMTTTQSYAEARSYAHHLSAQSAGVDNGVLYAKIKECMW